MILRQQDKSVIKLHKSKAHRLSIAIMRKKLSDQAKKMASNKYRMRREHKMRFDSDHVTTILFLFYQLFIRTFFTFSVLYRRVILTSLVGTM